MEHIKDKFSRPLNDLRISLIDRCNHRCPYCMPQDKYNEHYRFLEAQEWLSFDEIIRLVKVFIRCGVRKIRLTGGEPLLRPQLPELIKELSRIKQLDDLALTTNGSLLKDLAYDLKSAGLKRLTVSLDSLDKDVFRKMTGNKGSLNDVLEGLRVAQDVGFDSIKINTVIQRGVNDKDIIELVKYFRYTKHIVRFIEFMDVGNCNNWSKEKVVTSKEIFDKINSLYPLKTSEANYFGEVAERYEFVDGSGEIGFISSISQPFCRSCTRARLTADGQFITCLFANKGSDLRSLLRDNASDEAIFSTINNIWSNREDRYSELRGPFNSPASPKVEMFQIGG